MNYLFIYIFVLTAILAEASEHHHIGIGTDHFHMTDHQRKYSGAYKKTCSLSGVRLGYEYIEPNNFYFGGSFAYYLGEMTVFMPKVNSLTKWKRNIKSDLYFKTLEGRIGYNFAPYSSLHISPYLGISEKIMRSISANRMSLQCVQLVTGVRTEYALTSYARLGVNFRQFYAVEGKSKSTSRYQYLTPCTYGNEISLPFSLRFEDAYESVIVTLEPYFRKDSISSEEKTLGVCLQLACEL